MNVRTDLLIDLLSRWPKIRAIVEKQLISNNLKTIIKVFMLPRIIMFAVNKTKIILYMEGSGLISMITGEKMDGKCC